MATKVLIADDTLFMRTMLKDIFLSEGFIVIGEAVSGNEVVEKCKLLKPDLVTMDIVMPFKSGIEAVKDILKDNPAVKIVMISALGQEAMVNEAMAAGARAFVAKPFDNRDLIKKVNQVLGQN